MTATLTLTLPADVALALYDEAREALDDPDTDYALAHYQAIVDAYEAATA
jgi:hypothetical protein